MVTKQALERQAAGIGMLLREFTPTKTLKSYASNAIHENGSDFGSVCVTARTRKQCRKVLAAALREWVKR